MTHKIEEVIISNLIHDVEYCRKVLPFLDSAYFSESAERRVFECIRTFFNKYTKVPTQQILSIQLEDIKGISQTEYDNASKLISACGSTEDNKSWLLERTEKFCRDQALYNAIMESISILDDKNAKLSKDAIPSLLQTALNVTFDKKVGHDFFTDADSRYEFYHLKEDRIPLRLEMFNKITKGGLPKKTFNLVLAGCVHPETSVKIRVKSKIAVNSSWSYFDTEMRNIKSFLDYCHVEIFGEDDYQKVTAYIDKGGWLEYLLTLSDGRIVRVNENHLFETTSGWELAKDLVGTYSNFICDTGVVSGSMKLTGEIIPIVDIQVDHPNHRYYANGVSSHNTNVGKSLFLCDVAAGVIESGKNVLYITLEMAEERIAERIDCNLMDIPLDTLYTMKKSEFTSRMDSLRQRVRGKLVIKEYPTSGAHAGHFKMLLDELKSKKGFIPDLICIDYINICLSSRLKGNSGANSYTIVKSIAEELRGLAVEYDVPILSATQTTRQGWNNTDVEMSDISESAGTAMTVDFMFAMMRTEELDASGQIMIKQLKSRYNDVNYYKRFTIGVDINKFKLYNIDQPTKGLSDSGRHDEVIQSAAIRDRSGRANEFRDRSGRANEFDDFDFD